MHAVRARRGGLRGPPRAQRQPGTPLREGVEARRGPGTPLREGSKPNDSLAPPSEGVSTPGTNWRRFG